VLQTRVLEDLRQAHRYRRWLCGLARPWLGDDVLEAGSGSGDAAAEWAADGTPVVASEADPARLAALQTRFAGHPLVRVRELVLPSAETGAHSAVVAYNLLEHLPDDVAALRSFARLVRPGGHVIVLVPAFSFAYGRFDAEIGHHRRYTRRSLVRALRRANLEVVTDHYVNALGLLGWTLVVRLLGGRPKPGPLLWLVEQLVPVLRRVESRLRPPFGQSVFAVARVSS
jgi:SAM-dependent methyltransferase